jgi:acyl-CoA reductase-like NAD-dependent aldehyde dehydrogenase
MAGSDYTLTINGKAEKAEAVFDVVDPSTGKVFAQAPECSDAQLDAAMQAAATAFAGSWRHDEDVRKAAMAACADALVSRVDEIAAVLTTEQGKPLANAAGEVHGAAGWLKYYASLELPVEVIQDDKRGRSEVHRRPVGPVAAITPWNFPLLLAFWKIAPALRAGNTIVLKPSPYTPLSSLLLGEVLRDALPAGVLNVVSGGDALGAKMTEHPVPRKISFTGSVATGKRVAMSAAPDLKRVTLELGGNDAAIVLDDADPGKIAEKLFWGAFQNSGQVCAAVKRVYVPESLHDDLVDAMAALARTVRTGAGTEAGVQLGPINNKPQYDRVSGLVSDALGNGATAVTGGKPMDRDGYFFEPTILTGVSEGVRIVDEEQFGPALPIIKYTDEDDAVARANATNFGLGGSVWSADPERGNKVAGRLDVGSAWVNDHAVIAPHTPFGGAKWSGIGVENGPWGLLGFTEVQVRYTAK